MRSTARATAVGSPMRFSPRARPAPYRCLAERESSIVPVARALGYRGLKKSRAAGRPRQKGQGAVRKALLGAAGAVLVRWLPVPACGLDTVAFPSAKRARPAADLADHLDSEDERHGERCDEYEEGNRVRCPNRKRGPKSNREDGNDDNPHPPVGLAPLRSDRDEGHHHEHRER